MSRQPRLGNHGAWTWRLEACALGTDASSVQLEIGSSLSPGARKLTAKPGHRVSGKRTSISSEHGLSEE